MCSARIPSNFAVRIRMAACSQAVSAPASTVGASPWCIHRPGGGVVRAFPATPARLRRDAFSPSHAHRVQTRVNRTVSDCFHRFTGFYTCVWLNVVLGVGGVVWFANLPRLRLLYVDMAHVTFFYGNDETEFSKKLNFAKPQLTGVSPVFGSPVEMPRHLAWLRVPDGAA